jgi:methionyl-tRNA formyltransferase
MNKHTLPTLVFFGTPEFARYCLAHLVETGFNVKGVVTAPDRKAGRGKKVTHSAVKEYAIAKKLEVLQPTNLKSPEFIGQLQALGAEVYAVVAFRMLPKVVWSLPRLGTINLHASLLPDYKGAAPINWVLINGETETGVTTFLIDEAIDSGAVLMKETTSIVPEDNFETLHNRLLEIGAPLLATTLIQLSNKTITAKKQQVLEHTNAAPKLNAENTRIQWTSTLKQLVNHIRGLNPYPGAWTYLKNSGQELRVKIFDAEALYETPKEEKGTLVVKDSKLMIASAEGYLICKEIQLPNKKRMNAKALLNGYTIEVGAIVY